MVFKNRMTIKNKAYSPFSKVATWLLVLSPIIQTYGWGKYDFAFLLTSLLGVVAFVMSKIHTKDLPKYLLLYMFYWLIIHFSSATSLGEAIPLGVVKSILVYCTFFSVIKLPLLIRYYKVVARICIIFFFIQLVVKYVIGVNVPGVFSFLPLALDTDAAVYFQTIIETQRLCSFFSEPALFAQFESLYLCLLLFEADVFRRQKRIEIALVSLALLLMQSGNALLGLLIGFLFYVLFQMRGGARKKVRAVVLGIVLVIGAGIFAGTKIGQNLMSRQSQVSVNSVDQLGYSTSGFERVFRGYYIYQQYSTIRKIIGNDNPNYKIEAARKSIVSVYFNGDYLYNNTIQSYLLNTGLIGLLIMILVYKKIWERTNQCGKSILAIFIAFNFISSAYFTEIMCLYLLIPTLLGRYQLTQKSIVLNNNAK